MKVTLVVFHLVIGIVLFIVGLILLKDYWKTPSFILMSFGMVEMSISIGLYLKQRWVQWLIGALMLCATLITIILLAGSIMWPESLAGIIIIIYGIFMLIEILSWVQVQRLTGTVLKSNIV